MGKGSQPRNVGPQFHENFQDIDWHHDDTAKGTPLVKRTDTKRVYRYGPAQSKWDGVELVSFFPVPELVPLFQAVEGVPQMPCPNPGCENGGVDTGGVTPWGSPISDKCPDCDGKGTVPGTTVECPTPQEPKIPWPDPTPEMLADPAFEKVWQCIKRWDINVPGAYVGYMGATGNHVRAILDALRS